MREKREKKKWLKQRNPTQSPPFFKGEKLNRRTNFSLHPNTTLDPTKSRSEQYTLFAREEEEDGEVSGGSTEEGEERDGIAEESEGFEDKLSNSKKEEGIEEISSFLKSQITYSPD